VLGEAPQTAAPHRIITRHTLADARRGRVLLAEDNPTNQRVALRLLEKLGVRADAVANGLEALAALAAIPYDLVLMDCQMPELDGFETTRRVRDRGSAVLNHAVPIIALTAHAMKGDRERCLAAGMDDYLSKPIDPKAIASALERWLSPRRTALTPSTARPAAPSAPEAVIAPPAAAPAPATSTSAATPPEAEEPACFDPQSLRDRLMGDEELAREILQEFLSDMEHQLGGLREAFTSCEGEAVRRRAHQIKGACGNVGALAMQQIALELEHGAGGLAELGRLELAFAELVQTLRSEGFTASPSLD